MPLSPVSGLLSVEDSNCVLTVRLLDFCHCIIFAVTKLKWYRSGEESSNKSPADAFAVVKTTHQCDAASSCTFQHQRSVLCSSYASVWSYLNLHSEGRNVLKMLSVL
jgi:hypothetical protein